MLHDFGSFPGPDRYRHAGSDGPLPLGKQLSVTIHGEKVLIGTADEYVIGSFSMQGTQEALIRRDVGRRRITARDRDRYTDEQLARVRDPARRRSLAGWYRDLSFPEFFPAYASLKTDPDGNLWVQDYVRPGEERVLWRVFDSTGVYLGTLELPRGFTVFQVGRDFVLGAWVDALGTSYVHQYALRKPEPQPRRLRSME